MTIISKHLFGPRAPWETNNFNKTSTLQAQHSLSHHASGLKPGEFLMMFQELSLPRAQKFETRVVSHS